MPTSTSTVASVDGQTIMVKYTDGEKKVIVPPNTPIVTFGRAATADLKPGAQIIIIAATEAAGRNADRAGHQCRPRRRRAADVIGDAERAAMERRARSVDMRTAGNRAPRSPSSPRSRRRRRWRRRRKRCACAASIEKVDGNTVTAKSDKGDDAHAQARRQDAGRRGGEGVDGRHQGRRLHRQRSDAAARRLAEGDRSSHFRRVDARHRRRLSALGRRAQQHHDQRHGRQRPSPASTARSSPSNTRTARRRSSSAPTCRSCATKSAIRARSSQESPSRSCAAVKTPDGSYDIKRINVGRDGVVPR